MPDTFFTSSPHWNLYVLLYFVVGGMAGGSLFLAGLLHLAGRPEDRPTVRAGYWVAAAGAVLSGLLLTVDLDRPLRFWHMLIQSNTGSPMLKPWSPISVGAWALLGFGAVAGLASLGALGETRERWRRFAGLGRGLPGAAIALLGAGLGLFLAGYTGVLLSVTNRPIWADSNWIGALFLLSGVSAASALLVLLGRRYRHPARSLDWLAGFDRPVLLLELLALVVFLASLGDVARAWLGWNGALLLLGVVGAGILLPLRLHRADRTSPTSPTSPTPPTTLTAPLLVIFGSLLLRALVLTSSARIYAIGSGVAGP